MYDILILIVTQYQYRKRTWAWSAEVTTKITQDPCRIQQRPGATDPKCWPQSLQLLRITRPQGKWKFEPFGDVLKWGVPLVIIHFSRICPVETNHFGVPPFQETSKWQAKRVWMTYPSKVGTPQNQLVTWALVILVTPKHKRNGWKPTSQLANFHNGLIYLMATVGSCAILAQEVRISGAQRPLDNSKSGSLSWSTFNDSLLKSTIRSKKKRRIQ